MEAGVLDRAFTRGDDYALRLLFVDRNMNAVDYSPFTFTAQLRLFEDDVTIAAAFAVDPTDLATGVLVLTLPASVTKDLQGEYAWDLQFSPPITTLLKGTFTIDRDVTREP